MSDWEVYIESTLKLEAPEGQEFKRKGLCCFQAEAEEPAAEDQENTAEPEKGPVKGALRLKNLRIEVQQGPNIWPSKLFHCTGSTEQSIKETLGHAASEDTGKSIRRPSHDHPIFVRVVHVPSPQKNFVIGEAKITAPCALGNVKLLRKGVCKGQVRLSVRDPSDVDAELERMSMNNPQSRGFHFADNTTDEEHPFLSTVERIGRAKGDKLELLKEWLFDRRKKVAGAVLACLVLYILLWGFPTSRSGTAMCEGHGYNLNQCYSVGCCSFFKGECWSAVGDGVCKSQHSFLSRHIGGGTPRCEGFWTVVEERGYHNIEEHQYSSYEEAQNSMYEDPEISKILYDKTCREYTKAGWNRQSFRYIRRYFAGNMDQLSSEDDEGGQHLPKYRDVVRDSQYEW